MILCLEQSEALKRPRTGENGFRPFWAQWSRSSRRIKQRVAPLRDASSKTGRRAGAKPRKEMFDLPKEGGY